jgi:hypothetical protein
MEIHHKIKPPKNWREFLKEYGIIVLGVLTALGGEQAVEAIHHRSEVQETREALNEELGWNFTSFRLWVDQMDCVSTRLDELERWRESMHAGRPLKLLQPIALPTSVAFRTSVWRVSAGDAASRMPFDERVTYARVYDGIELTQKQVDLLNQVWADLMLYQQATKLSDDQLLQVGKDLNTLRAFNDVMRSNFRLMSNDASKLAIEPSKEPVFASTRAKEREVCKPLLVSRA